MLPYRLCVWRVIGIMVVCLWIKGAGQEEKKDVQADWEPLYGNVLVIASADFLKEAFLTQKEGEYRQNLLFFHGALEAFALDPRLLDIPRKREGETALSPVLLDVLAKLRDDVQVKYYSSGELPEALKPAFEETNRILHELKRSARLKFNYSVEDPEQSAAKYAEEKAKEYMGALGEGKTPTEPQPAQRLEDLFAGKKPPTPEEIRSKREKESAATAVRTGHKKEDVFHDLLIDEWKRVYLSHLEQKGVRAFSVTQREATATKPSDMQYLRGYTPLF